MTSDIKLPYVPSWRDTLAYRLATLSLRLGSKTYRHLLEAAWKRGLDAWIEDEVGRRTASET